MASTFRRLAAVLLSSTVLAAGAWAQDTGQAAEDAPVYLEADTLIDLENGRGYIARGEVRAQQGERTLFADELEYYPDTNRVIARGNVIMRGQGDYPQYAEEVELDAELSTGIALGFATLLENNGQMAAATAIRSANGNIELNDAYYTACPLCEDGSRPPTWRIRAGEVTQNVEDQMMYYRDAQLEVLGVPVLYAPVFAHPDPSSERRSGFLIPSVGASNRLGFTYQQPYLWSISPSSDLVVAPRYMSNVNPLLYTEYRKRFWSGSLAFEGSFTREGELDPDGDTLTAEEDQWHIFGGGRFNITEDWRWGFGVQRASYDLYLRRYDFAEEDRDRGNLLTAPVATLVSQLYLEGRTENSYGSAVAASYQALRLNRNDDTIPVMQPLVQYRHVFNAPEGWGRVNLDVSGAVLDRKDGSDYSRISAGADWRTRYITSGGLVVEPYALARSDAFDLSNLNPAVHGVTEDSFSRTVGLAGLEVSFPLYRPGNAVDWILEPVLSTTYASDDPVRDRIVNEDSLSLDLDEYLLFDPTRAAGNDIWEEGHWVAAGLRATAQWGESSSARVFFGQGERLSGTPVFDASSGVFEDSTDYITSGQLNWDAFSVEMAARLDQDDFDINRLDFSTSYRSERTLLDLRYTDISDDQTALPPRRELQGRFNVDLTEDWSLIGNFVRDLTNDLTRRQEVGFRYQDDCTRLDIVYESQESDNVNIGDSQSIRFEVTLITLGGFADG